ncbi:MAG TPA: single-stranded-DNA-specific exonuclease RecJ [Blastocatellia bacterium]|nr:single-stranded-DNA-specific exonuclease RecJ [Blastocatellia bacterium]
MTSKSMTSSSTKISRGISGARWLLADCDETALSRLQTETGEDPVSLRCLINRGLSSSEQIRKFLKPQFISDLHSPLLLRDMPQAVERLRRALKDRERILIVTDFDVDGTTSSVIISQTLKLLGGAELISCYIPDRFTEGYGLSSQIINWAAAEKFKVVVTADIGIKSHAEARLAGELGIDLIICDHHLPDGEDVPAEAFAVLCPKGSSGVDYPNKHLAACGVSLKLAEALLDGHPRREAILGSLAKLTAIGTIADMVDLSAAENRAIVVHGLKALSERSNNPGLRALMHLAQLSPPITTYDIGFKIGPRINAAGRIAHANSVLALFDAKTDQEATDLALQLDALNSERQHIQGLLLEKLKKIVDGRPAAPTDAPERVMVFAGSEEEGFHRGVIGIACSKIVEMTGLPTFICSIDEQGVAHGSARSIDGFHLVDALDHVSEVLVKYGGHPMAAGFTLKSEKIDEFRWRLNHYAQGVLTDEELGRVLTADAEIRLEQVTVTAARLLARLEPHGIGNPAPLFLIRRAPVLSTQLLKQKHLKLILGTDRRSVEALWWNASEYQAKLAAARELSLMCRMEINRWNNRESCQIKVVDVTFD